MERNRYLSIGAAEIYLQEMGTGPALCMLHGGLASAEAFYRQGELSSSYRVIIPERSGHGRSRDVPGPFTYMRMMEQTLSVLDALSIDKTHILGWSDGGIIGLLLALHHPSRVDRLCVVGAGFHVGGNLDSFMTRIRGLKPGDHAPLARQMYADLSPDGADHWPVVFEKTKRLWLNEPSMSEDEVRSIECPTLLVRGDRDDVVSPEHLVKMQAIMPNAGLAVLPWCGHDTLVEAPEMFNALLRRFLEPSSSRTAR